MLASACLSMPTAEQMCISIPELCPGECFRLYSEATFAALPRHSLPAIATARLDAVVLQIKLLAGSHMDPRSFGFVDTPPTDALAAAIAGLQAAAALDAAEALTPLGAALAMLPVDVHIGKRLVCSHRRSTGNVQACSLEG